MSAKKQRPICELVGCKNKVKLMKNRFCSRSCASTYLWDNNVFIKSERAIKARDYAKRNWFYKQLKEEIRREIAALGLQYSKALAKLYIRARNRGYNNGYTSGVRRVRKLA